MDAYREANTRHERVVMSSISVSGMVQYKLIAREVAHDVRGRRGQQVQILLFEVCRYHE